MTSLWGYGLPAPLTIPGHRVQGIADKAKTSLTIEIYHRSRTQWRSKIIGVPASSMQILFKLYMTTCVLEVLKVLYTVAIYCKCTIIATHISGAKIRCRIVGNQRVHFLIFKGWIYNIRPTFNIILIYFISVFYWKPPLPFMNFWILASDVPSTHLLAQLLKLGDENQTIRYEVSLPDKNINSDGKHND